jgi:hypothetical protein
MEAIRKFVDSNLLNDVIPLPKNFQNKRVELVIFLYEKTPTLPKLRKSDIDTLLKGSVSETLIGVLPYSNKTIKDYRAERLTKYERVD